MRKDDEFYCGRTELIKTNENKHKILIPKPEEKCGTKENPHETIRDVHLNIVQGSKFSCRKCHKTYQCNGNSLITITWNTE